VFGKFTSWKDDPSPGPYRTDAPGTFDAKCIDMRLGKMFDAFGGILEEGKVHDLRGLDWRQWVLWLKKRT